MSDSSPSAADEITCQSLTITDEHNRPRILLQGRGETPFIALLDEAGTPVMKLYLNEGCPRISFETNGQPNLTLGATPDGSDISFFDSAGQPSIVIKQQGLELSGIIFYKDGKPVRLQPD